MTFSAGNLRGAFPAGRPFLTGITASRTARYELKFPVPVRSIALLRERIGPYVQADPHGKGESGRYTVENVYFDTVALRFYRDAVLGAKRRKKIRLRTYSDGGEGETTFLEIKRKRGRRTDKERVPLSPVEAARFLRQQAGGVSSGGRTASEKRLLERINRLNVFLDLRPVILLRYRREAWEGIAGGSVRVTFDRHMEALPLGSERSADRSLIKSVSADDTVMMELKFDDHFPVWMKRVAGEMKLYPSSFSKYSRGIEACNIERRGNRGESTSAGRAD